MGRPTNRKQMRDLVNEYAEPFARAFAVFVNNLGDEAGAVSTQQAPAAAELQSMLKQRLADAIRRNDQQEREGTLDEFEFTGNSPKESMVHRIKQLMKQRGMNQRDLAAKL